MNGDTGDGECRTGNCTRPIDESRMPSANWSGDHIRAETPCQGGMDCDVAR